MTLLQCTLLLFCVNVIVAWDSEQLEVYDVVEEVKENFYNLLNISQDAANQEVKSAFRALSLKLHPDKNPGVDTSVQFRNLVSVYEVLRSSSKRKFYDEVLVNGLPNWRSAVYYYRYARKMGLVEVCIILFVILTIGQYLVNWAAYLEKIYTIEQNRKVKRKRSDKAEPDVVIPKPSVFDTLPIQIPKLIWYIIITTPQTLGFLKSAVAQQIEEVITKPPPVEEVYEPPPRVKTARKRNKFIVPEGPNFEMPLLENTELTGGSSAVPPPVSSGGLWTDDDLAELIKLVKKYPGGTSGRWEIIAEAMGRSVAEVTYMAGKMKENCYRLPSEQETEQVQVKVKQKTKKEDVGSDEAVKKWSQGQQRALEDALAKYPKGCADRWDRIADCIADKTKEECMLRFRFLAESLRKQKEGGADQQSLPE